MKKLLVITTLMVSMVTFVKAQDETDNREVLQFGGRVGLTYSNVYDTKGEKFDADAKVGFTAAAFLMIPLGKYLGIQPEVMLTQKGFQGKGNLLLNSYEITRTTTFLEIPILVALKPSEFITILAGPQYSYLLKQNDKITSSAFSYDQEQEFENDNIKKNIFGLVAGLDINLKHIVLGARIAWDMQANRGDGTASTPRYKNLSTQVTIGYKFY
jgi:hypothetical protein